MSLVQRNFLIPDFYFHFSFLCYLLGLIQVTSTDGIILFDQMYLGTEVLALEVVVHSGPTAVVHLIKNTPVSTLPA